MNRPLSYVLITPARNEASLIEGTILSVIGQTVLPLKWIIVSDGSTDGTDEIVKKYAASHQWLELLRMPERKERDFAAKVRAFDAGYSRVKELEYDLIGSLDADLTFDSEYFEFLLDKMARNPRLGLAGTPFKEGGVTYDYRFASLQHVSGACQLFRRVCFEEIGGYLPLKSGGIDLVAVYSARLKGWETRTFPEKFSEHHRKQGSAAKRGLGVILHDGKKDYLLGADPLWQAIRAANRMRRSPHVIGGLCLFFGYFWSMLLMREKTAPREVVLLRRKEQRERLGAILRGLFASSKPLPGASKSDLGKEVS